jgi:hypothetical protein
MSGAQITTVESLRAPSLDSEDKRGVQGFVRHMSHIRGCTRASCMIEGKNRR